MEHIPLHDLNFVSLQTAVLCVDCEIITENHGGTCRICGGRALLSLDRVFGGPLGETRAVLLDPAEVDAKRLVEDLIESAYRPTQLEDEPDEETAA